MSLYLNYDANTNTVSVNSYIKVDGNRNHDVRDLVDDILNGDSGYCPLNGALDAIQKSSLWDDSHKEALELIDSAIYDFYENE